MAMLESVVAEALAERLGADPERDPYPLLLATAAMGVMRAAMSFWASSGGAVPLDQLVDGASRRWPMASRKTAPCAPSSRRPRPPRPAWKTERTLNEYRPSRCG